MSLESKLEKKYQDIMSREVTNLNIDELSEALVIISETTNDEEMRIKAEESIENLLVKMKFVT